MWARACLFRRYPAQQTSLIARSISYTPSKSKYEVGVMFKLSNFVGVCTAEAQAVTVHKYPSRPKFAEKVSSFFGSIVRYTALDVNFSRRGKKGFRLA